MKVALVYIELYNIYFAAYFGIFMELEKSYDSHNTNIDIQMCSFIQIFLLNVFIVIYKAGEWVNSQDMENRKF